MFKTIGEYLLKAGKWCLRMLLIPLVALIKVMITGLQWLQDKLAKF